MLSQEEKITKDFYNINAGKWVAKHSAPSFWQEQREQFHSFLPSGKVIDLGCGGGNDTAWFLENGYEYLGVDASEAMLKEARAAHPQANYLAKDFYSLDFSATEFDGFWAACSLLHVPREKISAVLANIKNIIKPKGIGFISLKEGTKAGLETGVTMEGARYFAHYNEQAFKKILEENGFKVLASGRKLYQAAPEIFFIYYLVQSV